MKCKWCGKELKQKRSTKRSCNSKCRSHANYRDNLERNKKRVREYKRKNYFRDFDKKKVYMKEYYKKNKKKLSKGTLKYYHSHKQRFLEVGYVYKHRKEFLKLLPNTCAKCGKKGIKVIHHTTYDFPSRKNHKFGMNIQPYLKWYSTFLLGFCSRDCHRRYELLQNGINIPPKN